MPEEPKIHIRQIRYGDTVTSVAPYPKSSAGGAVLRGDESQHAMSSVRLAIRSKAAHDLLDRVGWGARPNVERVGALIGKYYTDMSGPAPILWGDVTGIIPFDRIPGTGSPADSRFAECLSQEMRDGEQIVGWYCTRRSSFLLGLTETELQWHRHFFEGAVGFAAVFYPHRQMWSVYHGRNGAGCRGDIFIDAEDLLRSADGTKSHGITILRVGGEAPPIREEPVPSPVLKENASFETIHQKLDSWWTQVKGLIRSGRQLSQERGSSSVSPPYSGRITVRDGASQEPEKRRSRPSISFRPFAGAGITAREERRAPKLRSEIWTLPDGDLASRRLVDSEELETIASDLSETVDAVLAKGLSPEELDRAPLHAHVALNADLTLGIFLREGPDNALICIASCTEEGIPASASVSRHIELIKQDRLAHEDDATYYLIYICDPDERRKRKVVVFQIKKGDDYEQ